jgi:hypothetical protein
MARNPYSSGKSHAQEMAQSGIYGATRPLSNRSRDTARWDYHASYNVAKKVLEFEFTAEIPRLHLRASYGDGFKGAPLNCEGSLTRDPGELNGQAAKKERHALGGTRHV